MGRRLSKWFTIKSNCESDLCLSFSSFEWTCCQRWQCLYAKTRSRKTFRFDDENEPDDTPSKEPVENLIDQEENKTQPVQKSFSSLNSKEEDELTALLSQINHKKDTDVLIDENNQDHIENEDEDEYDEETSFSWIDFIFNFIYIIATSFLIIFVGIIIYIALLPQFENPNMFFRLLLSSFKDIMLWLNHVLEFSLIAYIP